MRQAWSVAEATDLYGVQRWGQGYFSITSKGRVAVRTQVKQGVAEVELTEIVEGLQQRGLEMPVMLRIENLLHDRIDQLYQAFGSAISEAGYRGAYRGVFPIKVNQQNHVVSEIGKHGVPYSHGFEAGSKAELLIAMSTVENKDSLLICNGYKDEEFVDLGLQAQKIGFRCFFVIETLDELEVIDRRATHWNVNPLLGVRLKLAAKVEGHWANDSGDRSLFGLSPNQLVELIDRLTTLNRLDRLQMLHFHLGSQIPSIGNVRDAISEACRFYVELVKEKVPLEWLNIGGGLAVDYDGSSSANEHSRNYDLNEYCIDVVEGVMNALDTHGVPHPTIVSESGRWTVAPMSVLLFNVLGVNDFESPPITPEILASTNQAIVNLLDVYDHVETRRLQENYNDAVYYRDELRRDFQAGKTSLRERAMGENLCLTILNRIADLMSGIERLPSSLDGLKELLADIYYGNFSVFQSLPDAWAIGQVFPVMPIHRLDEEPKQNAIIADLTCDCDGKLDRFANREDGQSRTLRLHKYRPGEDYLLGVFLVGSYQETLGDMHNLFGDSNVASVRINEDGELEFVHELNGDSIADVLSYVEYQPAEMAKRFRALAETAVAEGLISVAERSQMTNLFGESLRGYTYFEG